MAEISDEEHFRRIGDGDSAPLRQLAERWEQPVYQIAWRVLGNRDDAEDVRQNVFLQLIAQTENQTETACFSAWIRRCTVNAALTLFRRRQVRKTAALPDEMSGADDSPEQTAEQTEEATRLHVALNQLSPEDRALLSLRFDEQLTFAQIGETLERPESTIKSNYARLLQQLKQLLAD